MTTRCSWVTLARVWPAQQQHVQCAAAFERAEFWIESDGDDAPLCIEHAQIAAAAGLRVAVRHKDE